MSSEYFHGRYDDLNYSNLQITMITSIFCYLKMCVLAPNKNSSIRENNVFDFIKLRELDRFHHKAIKQHTASHIDQIFPEPQYFSKSDVHQNFFYVIFKKTLMATTIVFIHNLVINTQSFYTKSEITNIILYMYSVTIIIPGICFMNGGMVLAGIGDIMNITHNVVKIMLLSKLIMVLRALSTGHIMMPLVTMPVNPSESSRKCLLLMFDLTLSKIKIFCLIHA